jgi:enoyl-CoA hydratase/carnithine racemase
MTPSCSKHARIAIITIHRPTRANAVNDAVRHARRTHGNHPRFDWLHNGTNSRGHANMKHIHYAVADRVATITLNRPERMNALNDDTVQELWDAVDTAARDDAVHVIVLTGAGRAFCAGGDIGGFGATDPRYLIDKMQRPFDMNRGPDYQTRHSLFPAIGKPIIAMINGATAGLGLLYALFCDVRFASEDAVFTTAFAKLGLTGEYGAAWILARIVGQAHALELLLSARRVRAEEALRIGLVNRICPADDLAATTYAYAREMADNCSPRSMRVLKQQVYDVPFQTLAEAVRSANEDMLITNSSDDFKEGYRAFLEKRRANFIAR